MGRSAALLRAGRVGAPHGLDGSFHVLEPRPQLLFLDAALHVGECELTVVRRAGTDRRPLLRLDGVNDREAAQGLRGAELLIPRELAPTLSEDEWWSEDLEGCLVRTGDVAVGTVQRVMALPSCEVLEVRREDGSELLVPLVSDAVGLVDVDRGEIEVDLAFLGER
ncbi:MAG: ribosome maturation factor RimM [Solirubrobacteraceae bacterium]